MAHLRLDGRHQEQVGGRKRFTTDGYAASPDRYEIEVLGGASEVRISAG